MDIPRLVKSSWRIVLQKYKLRASKFWGKVEVPSERSKSVIWRSIKIDPLDRRKIDRREKYISSFVLVLTLSIKEGKQKWKKQIRRIGKLQNLLDKLLSHSLKICCSCLLDGPSSYSSLNRNCLYLACLIFGCKNHFT